MPTTIDELKYILGLDNGRFFSAVRQTEAQFDKTKKKVERPLHISTNIQNAISGLARVGLAIEGAQRTYQLLIGPIRESIALSEKQEKAEAKLAAVLKATGGAAGFSADQLKEYASQLQAVTTIGDEETINLMAQLATFTSVTGDVFKEATELALDMAEVFDGDLKSGAIQLGKALNDPVAGISALTRVGIVFTEEQKESIKNFAAQNDIISAQRVVLAELRREFGGTARAIAETDAGKLQQFSNLIGDLKEQGGDLITDFLVPMTQLLKPLLELLVAVDPAVRNAGFAFGAFVLVGLKVPAVLNAITAASRLLISTFGPAGLLIVGIGAVAAALGFYTNTAEAATDVNVKLQESNINLANSFNQIRENVFKAYSSEPLDEILRLQEFYNQKLNSTRERINRINDAKREGERIDEDELTRLNQNADRQVNVLKAITDLIQQRRQKEVEAREGLTEEEQKELDKLREFQFQSNRISLADYINYLQSRRAAVREQFGAESLEYLQFADRITELNTRLREETLQAVIPDELQIREKAERAFDVLSTAFDPDRIKEQLSSIRIAFEESSFEALQTEFNNRVLLSDLNLSLIEQTLGTESDLYRKQVQDRLTLEASFQEARERLAVEGARHALALGDQLIFAFRENSETLFTVGKGLSIANATVNAYEAAARAYKDYPWPFNLGVAAIQLALGLAQVRNIGNVKFKGFQSGSGVLTQADLIQSLFTPPGEDGLVAVQTGELILNRREAQALLPLVRSLRRQQAIAVPAFQSGGVVGGGSLPPVADTAAFITREDFAEILADAFKGFKIEINSQIEGQDFVARYLTQGQKLDEQRRL